MAKVDQVLPPGPLFHLAGPVLPALPGLLPAADAECPPSIDLLSGYRHSRQHRGSSLPGALAARESSPRRHLQPATGTAGDPALRGLRLSDWEVAHGLGLALSLIDSEIDSEAEADSEADSDVELEADSEPLSDADGLADPEPLPEGEPDGLPECENDSEADGEVDGEGDVVPDGESDGDSEPDSDPEPE